MTEAETMHAYKISCNMLAKARNLTRTLNFIQTAAMRDGESMEDFAFRVGEMHRYAIRFQMQFDTMYAAMKKELPYMHIHIEEDR